MLSLRNVSKEFRKKSGWFRAVNDVSFDISPGEIVGILGPNGAGKTTMLRCIAGILRPSHGQILINGFDSIKNQAEAKRGMAYVPEVPSLYELLTVEEHLKFVAMCFSELDEYTNRKEELLRRYHLWDKREELVATLSKGMRQKLSVACAMIHRANVFLFDEPLIGIDPAGAAEMKQELIEQKKQGSSILVSTHLLDTAERLCDRVIIMAEGTILFQGTFSDLKTQRGRENATLEELFLELTEPKSDAPPHISHPQAD